MRLFLHSFACLLAVANSATASKSAGCDAVFSFPAEPGGPAKGVQIDDRRVWVTLPKTYKHGTPAPLIFAFHDVNQTVAALREATRLSDPKLNPDAIVLYPEAGRWLSDDEPNLKIDDKEFLLDLLDGISDRLCVDEERIYATGLGTGAGLCHLLACDRRFASRIAAFSLVNPLLQVGLTNKKSVKELQDLLWEHCKPKRLPVRIQEIHGVNNTLHDYWVGFEEPNKADDDPRFFETILRNGIIREGQIYENKLQKATYLCWEDKRAAAQAVKRDWARKKKKNAAAEQAKQVDLSVVDEIVLPEPPAPESFEDQRKRGNNVVEHFHVRDYGHGWPRIVWKEKVEETNETTVADWSFDMGDVDFAGSTKDEVPHFDATKEILRWFSMARLSDGERLPLPPKPKDAVFEDEIDEEEDFEAFEGFQELLDQLDEEVAQREMMQDAEGGGDAPTDGGKVVPSAEKGESVQRDEL